MNRLRIIFAFLCFTSIAHAQIMSLSECVDMALLHNKEIKSAQWKVEQYKNTEWAMRANQYPNISAQITDVWSSSKGNVTMDIASPFTEFIGNKAESLIPSLATSEAWKSFLTDMQGQLTGLNPIIDYSIGNVFNSMITIEQPIYMGGKITAAYQMGKLGHRMAKLGVRLTEDEVTIRVNEAYSLMVKAKEMTKVATKYDSLIHQIERDVESAVHHGMAKQADLMKVRVAKNKALLQIRQAENGLLLSRMNLCQIVGLPLVSAIDVEPIVINATDILPPDRQATIINRPEFELLALKTELAGRKVKLEKSNFLPEVGVAVSGGYMHGVKMLNQTLFGNRPYAMVALNVKIPIYHGGEAKYKVNAARAEYTQARLEQEDLNEKLELQLQMAANELDEAILEVELCTKSVDEAAEGMRLSTLAYSVGMETLSDVLTAQTEWQNAYATLIEARHQLLLKDMSWKRTAGLLRK